MALIGVALAGAVAMPAAADGAVMTRFKPAVDGFHFVNYFNTNLTVTLRFPSPIGKRKINLGKHSFGLCGGMSYSALDYFLAGKPIPADTMAPTSGPLFNYILHRQIDTFTAGTLARFATYPLAIHTDHSLTNISLNAFKNVVKRRLDAGHPVPLGLIKTKGFSDLLTGNHQVLAIGYSLRQITITTKRCFVGFCTKPKKQRVTEPVVAIYDPNYPGQVKWIQTYHKVETDDEAGRTPVAQHHRVRGYFTTPYQFHRP